MATLVAPRRPGLADRAWAAGFLEGEGAFVSMHERGIRVKAVQVNREPLERLQQIFGGRIYGQKAQGNRQDSFVWVANGKLAEVVIKAVYDLLSARRGLQAQALLSLRE